MTRTKQPTCDECLYYGNPNREAPPRDEDYCYVHPPQPATPDSSGEVQVKARRPSCSLFILARRLW